MSDKINTFKTAINNYISIDDQIKLHENTIKVLKKNRIPFETAIIETIKFNNIVGKDIKIGTNKLRFDNLETNSGLTQGHIKDSLTKYFIEHYSSKMSAEKCNEKAMELYKYILDSREKKERSVLKRVFT